MFEGLDCWLGDNYAKSHDLLALILKLASLGEDTTGLSELADLNPFAVQYRYESLDLDEDDLDRPRLLETIEQLFERVEMLLP